MTAGDSAVTRTPAERDERWQVSVLFAIEAASAAEARAIMGGLDGPLPLQGEASTVRLGHRDGIWVCRLSPDLTVLASIDPDDTRNR